MRKPCLKPRCPDTAPSGMSYCKAHTLTRRPILSPAERGLGADHRRIVAQVLAQERVCWLCGQPATSTDPLVGDHIIPRSKGGQNVRSNYHAAHASCNARRGNKRVVMAG